MVEWADLKILYRQHATAHVFRTIFDFELWKVSRVKNVCENLVWRRLGSGLPTERSSQSRPRLPESRAVAASAGAGRRPFRASPFSAPRRQRGRTRRRRTRRRPAAAGAGRRPAPRRGAAPGPPWCCPALAGGRRCSRRRRRLARKAARCCCCNNGSCVRSSRFLEGAAVLPAQLVAVEAPLAGGGEGQAAARRSDEGQLARAALRRVQRGRGRQTVVAQREGHAGAAVQLLGAVGQALEEGWLLPLGHRRLHAQRGLAGSELAVRQHDKYFAETNSWKWLKIPPARGQKTPSGEEWRAEPAARVLCGGHSGWACATRRASTAKAQRLPERGARHDRARLCDDAGSLNLGGKRAKRKKCRRRRHECNTAPRHKNQEKNNGSASAAPAALTCPTLTSSSNWLN